MNNKEIMHDYVHCASSDSGKASNVRYANLKLYSYNTCMVNRVRANGEHVYLVNCNSYSSTTSKQMGYFWGALPNYSLRFLVDDPEASALSNAKEMFKEIMSNHDDMNNTTHKGKKQRLTVELDDSIEQLRKFMDMFDVKCWTRKKAEKMLMQGDLGEELNASIHKMRKAEQAAERKRKRDRIKAAEIEQKESRRKYDEEDKPKWLDGSLRSIHVPTSIGETLCRIKTYGNEEIESIVETSRGARIKLSEASRLAQDLLDDKAVPGHDYDGFRFVKFNKTELVIGCHHIAYSEVVRMVRLLAKGV